MFLKRKASNMIYSDFYVKEKTKVPTILGLFIVLMSAVFLGRVFMTETSTTTRASKKTVRRLDITNISPVQSSIYWQSDNKESGWIVYSDDAKNVTNIALDDRDVSEKKSTYLNHYVTLRDLQAGKQYYFKIVTGNQIVVSPDGSLFSFKTPTNSPGKPILPPANGKVEKPNLAPQDNAIVVLYVDGYIPLSTITKPTGEWLIPLNSFYDKDTLENKSLSANQKCRVEIINEDGQVSALTCTLSRLSPVAQTTIIGKDYNFQADTNNVLSAMTSFTSGSGKSIDIIYPIEGSIIPGKAPLIKGVALPQAKVYITVNSQKTYSAVVTADGEGLWNYLVPGNLELGNHTITIKTKNIDGKDLTIERKFVIVANGDEGKVLGVASAAPTTVITPTIAPTSYTYPTTTLAPIVSPTALLPSGLTDTIPALGGFSLIAVGLGVLLVF